jgi:hypothetical protein
MPVVIHRNIPGEHILSKDCWCYPMIVEDDDLRTTQQLLEESDRKDLRI